MYRLLRPLLFSMDPERSHRLALRAAGIAERLSPLAESVFKTESATLRQTVFDADFNNPVGLAAGFDKNADHLGAWGPLGFGFCEIGSVTAETSSGNPPPRVFRLRDDLALINRMGLPSDGADSVAARLAELTADDRSIPIGVNIAKTHDPGIVDDAALDDFARSIQELAPHADYLALNISCPNTTDGNTFEEPAALSSLLERVMPLAGATPVLVKVSPPGVGARGVMEFGSLDDLVDVALSRGVAGFIATNTARDRVNLATDPSALARMGPGGLSGPPLAERALATVRRLYRTVDGKAVIIAVGGVDSADVAYERIRAGATLVQVYTALIYKGPGLVRKINRGLVRLLKRDGFSSIVEAIGADA